MFPFKIIPAIDLIDGKCVRLIQGDYAQKTIYNADPRSTAEQFLDAGFDLVHVVDLDGAKDGEPKNLKSIEDIASCGITIELGGGLRTEDHLTSAINAGAQDLILGTKLLNPPHCPVVGVVYKSNALFPTLPRARPTDH